MKLLLNPYSLIIRENSTCHFVFTDLSDTLEITLSNSQNELLEHLKSGESMEQDELEAVFTHDVVKLLLERGVLTENETDTNSIFQELMLFSKFSICQRQDRAYRKVMF